MRHREASLAGIGSVVLWGPFELCWKTRYTRQLKRRRPKPSHRTCQRKNRPALELYESADYDVFGVLSYENDGSRPRRETLLECSMDWLANQALHSETETRIHFTSRYKPCSFQRRRFK